MKKHRVVLSMGTRPEIIKMAPVWYALKEIDSVEPVILHTGQHNELAWPLYKFFGILPDYEVNIDRNAEMSGFSGQTSPLLDLVNLGAKLLKNIGPVMHNISPSMVLVHGDTLSTFMAGLAAFYMRTPVGHVEAGLRSYDKYQPFPEEVNRAMVSRIADVHFTPGEKSKNNLLNEGIKDEDIFVVGNTVVDAVKFGISHIKKSTDVPDVNKIVGQNVAGKKIILMTAHRRENLENNISVFCDIIKEILESEANYVVVWPVHPNPAISAIVEKKKQQMEADCRERFFVIKPLEYPSLLSLLNESWLLMTDSGGLVEEAATLKKPSLILRNTTERQELVEQGFAQLVGADKDKILNYIGKLSGDQGAYDKMVSGSNPYGDGIASKKMAAILKARFSW